MAQTVRILVDECPVPVIGFAGGPFTLASYLVEGGPSRDYLRTKALMYTDRHLWASLMERLADMALASLRDQVAAGAAAVQVFDSWVGTLSPGDYRAHVLPASRRIFAGLADLGVPRIHFGVGTGELLGLMAEAGADVIGVDWRVPLVRGRPEGPRRGGRAGQPGPGRVSRPLGGGGDGGPAHYSGAAGGLRAHLQPRPRCAAADRSRHPGPAGGSGAPGGSDRVRVAVIGGGIAGLAAAWELRGQAEVTVFEPDRLGGKILTTEFDGHLVDEGPDAFIARVPDALQLCREVGVEAELVSPGRGAGRAVVRGRLRPIPAGLVLGVPRQLGGVLRSGILSPTGMARAGLDLVLPRGRPPATLTVRELVAGRFGAQVADRLVDPLVGGIHAGSTATLGAAEVTPMIVAAAQRSRSLLLGLREAPPGESGPVFATLRRGLGQLVAAMIQRLQDHGTRFVSRAGRHGRPRARTAGRRLAGPDALRRGRRGHARRDRLVVAPHRTAWRDWRRYRRRRWSW